MSMHHLSQGTTSEIAQTDQLQITHQNIKGLFTRPRNTATQALPHFTDSKNFNHSQSMANLSGMTTNNQTLNNAQMRHQTDHIS